MRIFLTSMLLLFFAGGIHAQKIHIINSVDDIDDGVCNSAHCSLREAINAANADGIPSMLWFEITGTGIRTIFLESELPTIIDTNLIIEGTTITGNFPTKGKLVIDGNHKIANCFTIESAFVRIYGLQIQNFVENAILVDNPTMRTSRRLEIGKGNKGNIFLNNGNVLKGKNINRLTFRGNYVGTDLDFNSGLGNRNGVLLDNDWDSFEDAAIVIGGRLLEERNYFASCSEIAVKLSYHGSAKVEGNVFGTGIMGTERLGNDIAIESSSGRGNIDIGGSLDTKNIFAYNQSAVIIDENEFVSVSENSFYCNNWGLNVIKNRYPVPVIESGIATILTGFAQPDDFVEIYITDAQTCNSIDCQGMKFLGTVRATTDGTWEFPGFFQFGQQVVALSRNAGRQSVFSDCFRICPSLIQAYTSNGGPYCQNDSIVLASETDILGFQWVTDFTEEDVKYLWTGPNGYISEEQSPTDATEGGEYILQTILLGCPSNPDTTNVEMTFLNASIPEHEPYCEEENITISSIINSNADALSFHWTGPNGFESTAQNPTNVIETGQYNLVLSNDVCVSETVSVNITNNFPEAIVLTERVAVCEGESVSLALAGYDYYQWEGDFELTCDTCAAIEFIPIKNGQIRLSAGPTDACFTTKEVDIELLYPVFVQEERLLCAGDYTTIFDQEVNTAGEYTTTFLSANGCDSTHTIILTKAAENIVFEAKTICEGETLDAMGTTFTESGRYQVQYVAANGCDSTHVIDLEVLKQSIIANQFTICEGETIDVFGEMVSIAGVYTENFTAFNGCDSIHSIEVIVNETHIVSEKRTICSGESIELFDELTVSENGSFQKQFIANNGCDSTHIIEIEVLESIQTFAAMSICEDEVAVIFGENMSLPGTYKETFTAQSGCDSVHTVSLEVLTKQEVAENVTICSNETYLIGGESIATSGTYTQNLTGKNGCDSVHIITLEVLERAVVSESFTICEGETVEVFGEMIKVAGTFTNNYTSFNGCDSIHTIAVIVNETHRVTEKRIICAGESIELFDELMVSENGSFQKQFIANNGCDSTHIFDVEVLEPIQTSAAMSICEDEVAVIFGESRSISGTYTKTFIAQSGCDSVHMVNLEVLTKQQVVENVTICSSETYLIDGREVGTTGSYTQNLTGQNGCDSVHVIELEVLDQKIVTQSLTICEGESVDVFGEMIDTTGTFTKNFTTFHGCDSIHTIAVIVNETHRVTEKRVICYGEFIELFDELTISQNGVFQKQFTANNGCDSTHIIEVEVLEPIQTSAAMSICEDEIALIFGESMSFPGTYTETFTAQSGCDSVHMVTLEVLTKQQVVENVTICSNETYLIDGEKVETSGFYTESFVGQNGCDSTHSIDLTVLETPYSFEEYKICDGETVNVFDQTVSKSAILTRDYQSVNGCDSFHTVTVIVLPASATEESIAICEGESIEVFGQMISDEGIHQQKFIGQNGCDSTHAITINILQPVFSQSTLVICEGECESIYDVNICADKFFKQTFTGSVGCDSIHTTNLEIVKPTEVTKEYILCYGDSITALGTVIKEEGTYSESFTGNNGCDSFHTVILHFKDKIETAITTKPSCLEQNKGEIELNISGGLSPYTINWSEETLPNTTKLTELADGEYEVTVTDFLNCSFTETIKIEAFPEPSIEQEIQEITCFGANDGQIVFLSSQNLSYSLNGSFFNEAGVFDGLSPNEYQVLIKDEIGCEYQETFNLIQPEELKVNLPEEVTIKLGNSITLSPELDYYKSVNYEWEEIATLNCLDCENPEASPLTDTKYVLTVYDEFDCAAQDEIWVRVDADKDIYIPNIFSPNGDGTNDNFTILAPEGPVSEIGVFRIFDRWGTLVYQADKFEPNNDKYGWNGTFNGQKMDNGVYIYYALVKYKDGTETMFRGDVTLAK